MASPAAAMDEGLFTWIATTHPTAYLFPTLPYHLSLLPSLFRITAFLFFLPVMLLAFADIIGWTVFKLILRPLGYASVIRFKDPEPSTLLDAISASTDPSVVPTKKPRPLSTLIAPSSPSSPEDSPALSYDDSANSSPSLSPRTPTIPLSSPLLSKDSASVPIGRPRSSTGSSTSSSSSMHRFSRATSVGVEGPLFAADELLSPARSDDEDLPLLERESSTSEGETVSEGGARKRKGKVPRGGPAFGMTNVE